MRINVMAQLRCAVAFTPHVAGSARKVMAAVSSGGASMSQPRGSNYVYRSSKVALNLCMAGLARELKDRGIISVMLAPGWTRTDMGGADAPFALEDSVSRMRRIVAGVTPADSGRFINRDGADAPW